MMWMIIVMVATIQLFNAATVSMKSFFHVRLNIMHFKALEIREYVQIQIVYSSCIVVGRMSIDVHCCFSFSIVMIIITASVDI
jgi:hypothetical protein